MRASEMGDFGSKYLRRCLALRGMRRVKAQAEASGKPIQVFLGADATEAQLREINSPRILHLATHGFFLPESKDEHRAEDRQLGIGRMNLIGERRKIEGAVILKNPMHRSGLALAGAQRTLEAWAKGEAPPSDNDGIVTAEEVGIEAERYWLVVLSACETGTGQAKAGEGVMGLRRGFIQAGAQNLLMTLGQSATRRRCISCSISTTALLRAGSPQALLDVQREWLVRLRKEKGLFYAVNRAGPFIMSSQGSFK